MYIIVFGEMQQIMIAKPYEHYSLLKSCNFVQVAKHNNPILQKNLQSTKISPFVFQCETLLWVNMFRYETWLI